MTPQPGDTIAYRTRCLGTTTVRTATVQKVAAVYLLVSESSDAPEWLCIGLDDVVSSSKLDEETAHRKPLYYTYDSILDFLEEHKLIVPSNRLPELWNDAGQEFYETEAEQTVAMLTLARQLTAADSVVVEEPKWRRYLSQVDVDVEIREAL